MNKIKKDTSPVLCLYIILISIFLCIFTIESMDFLSAKSAYRYMYKAAEFMNISLKEIALLRQELGIPFDDEIDPNHTGIMGVAFSLLTTSSGNVIYKRTCTNPNFAAVVVKLFKDAGLKKGDVVAIGSSGSYPALLLAALCAANSLDLVPYVTYSYGSSMYGSTLENMTFPIMLKRLREKNILPYEISAVSMGGRGDQGSESTFTFIVEAEYEEGEQARFLRQLCKDSGIFMIDIADTANNIAFRLNLFQQLAGDLGVKCFVNVGGASYNYGFTSDALNLSLLTKSYDPMPQDTIRGMTFEFLALGVPVINLLNATEIAEAGGLPMDPIPLPLPGEGDIYKIKEFPYLWAAICLALTFAYVAYNYAKKKRPKLRP